MKRITMVRDSTGFWEIYRDIIQRSGFDVQLVDAFRRSDRESLLSGSPDAFIWRAKHTPSIKELARRFICYFDVERGIPTFPTWKSFWHYDDKMAQYFIFKEKRVPIPETYLFFDEKEAMAFANDADYPIIYKCPHGAGSANVGLLRKRSQAVRYVKRAFGRGLRTYFKSEVQRGHVLFQEFLSSNRGDYRLVCHGQDCISGFFRYNREDAPLASGSGQFDLGPLPEDVLQFTAHIHHQLGYDVMSYDILKDNHGRWVVTEMSVIFGDLSHVVYDRAPVYRRDQGGRWRPAEKADNRHERFIRHLLKGWMWSE